MIDVRMKIYQELINSSVIQYTDDRIFQANSLYGPTTKKPFLVLRMGLSSVEQYVTGTQSTYFQLWAHDDPGDYHQIDQILSEARAALLRASPETGFFEFRYFETSQDFMDDLLGTILRFSRFQAITRDPLPVPLP